MPYPFFRILAPCFATLLAAFLGVAAGSAVSAADVAVVCPAEYREALKPWLAHRAKQGHSFRFVSHSGGPADIQARIRQIAREHKLKYVLIVGDVDASSSAIRQVSARPRLPGVPTAVAAAKVISKIAQEKDIASDNLYGDLTGDGLPELAVGRLTADSPVELAVMIQKIIDYETRPPEGGWQRRINLVAGVGGFGVLADTAIELAARKFIVDGVPPEYCVTMTQASWRSPYFPDPRRFRETAIARMNEGCLFWVYIGHGQRRHLDWVHTPDGRHHPILTTDDVDRIRVRDGAPIALFMACYTGAFDDEKDCLAEELLRQKEGPVAVLASSRAAMPYAMGVLSTAMLKECFVHRRETIGEIFVHAKRNLVLGKRDDEESKALDGMAKIISVNTDLKAEREEHVRLFNLFGDPMLRVGLPGRVTLRVEGKAEPGGRLRVSGASDVDGEVTVELALRRDRLTFPRPRRPEYDGSDESLAALQETYAKANDQRVAAAGTTAKGGKFAAELTIPQNTHGDCRIRVTVRGPHGLAAGAERITVEKANAHR